MSRSLFRLTKKPTTPFAATDPPDGYYRLVELGANYRNGTVRGKIQLKKSQATNPGYIKTVTKALERIVRAALRTKTSSGSLKFMEEISRNGATITYRFKFTYKHRHRTLRTRRQATEVLKWNVFERIMTWKG